LTTWVGVLPFVHRPYRDACVQTMAPVFRANVLEVDNTGRNIGIMASHNRGIDRMHEVGADWLVVLGASLRFGPSGGMDFITQLDEYADHDVLEGPRWTPDSEGQGVYGWHLIAFRSTLLTQVGRWDENFTPYGFCDLDMSLRIQRALGRDGRAGPVWDKVPCDVSDAGMGHGIHLAGVRADANPQIDYFRRKWGRHPGDSQLPAHERPFNDPTNPIGYWPPAANGGHWND
jgi:hypothetical protein